MIGNQNDFNEIVFDDAEVRRNVNQILWRSRTVDVCSSKKDAMNGREQLATRTGLALQAGV